ncbi:DUF1715-domain-containing protein [Camillea tinctor]|nr:DUF1715-domain-containing protein [Camillea tinctor]
MNAEEDDDIFAGVLNLEEEYYREGYAEGYRDGAEAGRVEGRSVGYKTGFDKFVEAGRLQGRAVIWANRMPAFRRHHHHHHHHPAKDGKPAAEEGPAASSTGEEKGGEEEEEEVEGQRDLPPIPSNPRLERHVATLYGLVEPGTLSTRNDDDSVNDFDSRMKGAQGRVRMVERALGEAAVQEEGERKKSKGQEGAGGGMGRKNENIEDI